MAISVDGHVLSSYGDSTQSWTLLYNLFADKLLQTRVVDDDVRGFSDASSSSLIIIQIYQSSTNYYKSLLASNIGQPSFLSDMEYFTERRLLATQFGLPLDSTVTPLIGTNAGEIM